MQLISCIVWSLKCAGDTYMLNLKVQKILEPKATLEA